MSPDELTCVIPTHNRPQFLRRLLHCYAQIPPNFRFFVADSSGPAAAAENRAVIEGVQPTLDVTYEHFDLNFTAKCAHALQRVPTPYVVFCADDDYVFSRTAGQCVEFLKQEPAFESAQGRTVEVRPKHPAWCSRVLKGYSIEHDVPFVRCRQLAATWFTNFYAVYRTATLREIFRLTAENTNSALGYQLPEMLVSQLSVLRGKLKVLPTIHSLMERHDSNAGAATRKGVRPQAEALYERFKTCLTEQFVLTGADRAEVEAFIDREYGYFRETNLAIRRRPRSTGEVIVNFLSAIRENVVGWSGGSNLHRRFVRASDLAGCEPVWQAAVQLVQQFPQGISAEQANSRLCA
jgi:glycosyltransferase domain-containing protein